MIHSPITDQSKASTLQSRQLNALAHNIILISLLKQEPLQVQADIAQARASSRPNDNPAECRVLPCMASQHAINYLSNSISHHMEKLRAVAPRCPIAVAPSDSAHGLQGLVVKISPRRESPRILRVVGQCAREAAPRGRCQFERSFFAPPCLASLGIARAMLGIWGLVSDPQPIILLSCSRALLCRGAFRTRARHDRWHGHM